MGKKTLEQTVSAIFNLLKQKGGDFNYSRAKEKINSDYFWDALSYLVKVDKLVILMNNFLELTHEGERHKNYNRYLKSLRPKKPLDAFKIILIIITVVSVFLSIYLLISTGDP